MVKHKWIYNFRALIRPNSFIPAPLSCRLNWGVVWWSTCFLLYPEVGIYNRKQESKKTRKKELDQESDPENKKKRKKIRSRPRKLPRKEENFLFFLFVFLVESVFSWPLSFFLERVLFFLDDCVHSWTNACFLTFFFFFY